MHHKTLKKSSEFSCKEKKDAKTKETTTYFVVRQDRIHISEYRGVIYNVDVVMHALVLKPLFSSHKTSCKRCKLLRFWNLDKRKKESRKDNKDQVRQKMRIVGRPGPRSREERLLLTAFLVCLLSQFEKSQMRAKIYG